MTRASAASGRFAQGNILLLCLGLGLFQASRQGWRWVTASSALESCFEPASPFWSHVASTPEHLRADLPVEAAVDLWWSPVEAGIVFGLSFLLGLLLCRLTLGLVRSGTTAAHLATFRGEKRMTAALHYGTAWLLPVFVGILVASLRVISYIGAQAHWAWYPPLRGFELAGAVVVAFGLVLWWFWLLRLGMTAPAQTRGRVVLFLSLGAPVIAGSAIAAWWYGLDRACPPIFRFLGVAFDGIS